MGKFLAYIVVVALLSIFLGIGVTQAVRQTHLLTHAVAVPATIDRVEIRESSKKNAFYPVVAFRYRVEGREYASDHVFCLDVGESNRRWAESVVARFHPGDEVQALVDQENPADAFLLKDANFFPYMFLLFGMLFVHSISAVLDVSLLGLHLVYWVTIPWAAVAVVTLWHHHVFDLSIPAEWLPPVAVTVYVVFGAGLLVAIHKGNVSTDERETE
jgi:Protein of unknown function (DUF3592)